MKCCLFLLCLTASSLVHASQSTLQLDLDGDGTPEKVMVQARSGGKDQPLKVEVQVGGQTLILSHFEEYELEAPLELKAVKPHGAKQQWLEVIHHGVSDFISHYFVSFKNGRLHQVGHLSGQGKVTVPGNGSITQTVWMGFWTRTIKHEIRADDSLVQLQPEFYAVGVKGKVLKPFSIALNRSSDGVLARPRVGSEVEVLLFQRDESKSNGEDDEINDWYLIKSETGFAGWIRMKVLRDDQAVELGWAG